jgi:hypothetical protein
MFMTQPAQHLLVDAVLGLSQMVYKVLLLKFGAAAAAVAAASLCVIVVHALWEVAVVAMR